LVGFQVVGPSPSRKVLSWVLHLWGWKRRGERTYLSLSEEKLFVPNRMRKKSASGVLASLSLIQVVDGFVMAYGGICRADPSVGGGHATFLFSCVVREPR
jgi:hypothetical protein